MKIFEELSKKYNQTYIIKHITSGNRYMLYNQSLPNFYADYKTVTSEKEINFSYPFELRLNQDGEYFDMTLLLIKKCKHHKILTGGFILNQVIISSCKNEDNHLKMPYPKNDVIFLLKNKPQSLVNKHKPNFNILLDKDFDFLIPKFITEIQNYLNCQEAFSHFLETYRPDIYQKYQSKLKLMDDINIFSQVEDRKVLTIHLDSKVLKNHGLKSQYTLNFILDYLQNNKNFNFFDNMIVDNQVDKQSYFMQLKIKKEFENLDFSKIQENIEKILHATFLYYEYKTNLKETTRDNDFKNFCKKVDVNHVVNKLSEKTIKFIQSFEIKEAIDFTLNPTSVKKYKINNKTLFISLGRFISNFKVNENFTDKYLCSSVYPIKNDNFSLTVTYSPDNLSKDFSLQFIPYAVEEFSKMYQKAYASGNYQERINVSNMQAIDKLTQDFYINYQLQHNTTQTNEYQRKIKKL